MQDSMLDVKKSFSDSEVIIIALKKSFSGLS